METASLRVKFKPILKNVSNENDSDCTIEIVPEVSGFQNLEKIEWKMDDGLIEYTIPMTYKIYIKKENDETKFNMEKTYHSCVDLLHSYSLSSTNLAYGDITRILSDNFFISKLASDVERCDIIVTKKDFKPHKSIQEITEVIQKTASIQTLSKNQFDGSQSTMDQSMQIDFSKSENNIVEIKDETQDFPLDDCREKNNSTTLDISNECPETENLTKPDLSNKKQSTQRLTLTPICSINTCESMPLQENISIMKSTTLDAKTVSKSNIFKEFVQSLSGGDNCDPVFRVNEKYFDYLVLDKRDVFRPSENSNKMEGFEEKSETSTITPSKVFVNKKYQEVNPTSAINDFIYKSHKYAGLKAVGESNYNIIFNPQKFKQPRLIELQNTVVTLHGNEYKSDKNDSKKSSGVKVINSSKDKDFVNNAIKPSVNKLKRNHIIFNKSEKFDISRNNSETIVTNKSKKDDPDILSTRVPKIVKVSKFIKFMEKEIHPLICELNDIRNKCVSYGFFTQYMLPSQNCNVMLKGQRDGEIFEKQLFTKFEKDTNEKQEIECYEINLDPQNKMTKHRNRKKPNRVVYSILFND